MSENELSKTKSKKKSKNASRITPSRSSECKPTIQRKYSNIGLVWDAPFFDFSGYAEEARAYAIKLQELGFPVVARNFGRVSSSFIEQIQQMPSSTKIGLKNILATSIPQLPISVVHLPPDRLKRVLGSEYSIARTMFETNSLPNGWVDSINKMDEVWVPSSFNEISFKQAGVTIPIYIVPDGVDTTLFHPKLYPLPIPNLASKVFLSIFEWSFRKGWDILLNSWAKAFTSQDDVCLLIRSSMSTRSDLGKNKIESRIKEHLESKGFDFNKVAPIIILNQEIAIKDMPRLLATADVYVSPTRGEGVGRPQLESMACGVPVISTRWSGMLDFMNDSNSYLIDIEGLEEIDERMELEHFRGQYWAKPSEKHLVALFKHVMNNPDEAKQKATQARLDIEQNWTWEKAVTKIVGHLERIIPQVNASRQIQDSQKKISIGWQGDIFSTHSLSLVNREILSRVSKTQNLQFHSSFGDCQPYPAEFQEKVKNVNWNPNNVKNKINIEVRHQWPPDFSTSLAQIKILVQPWEFGGIPNEWIEPIKNEFDEIWCPSSWVKQCYIDSGIPKNKIQVIPNGVNTSVFTPLGPKFKLKTKKSFKFLFLGGTIYRKGIDLLVETYLDTFSISDDVCLVIKSFGTGTFYTGIAMDQWIKNLAKDPFLPEIELIEEDLNEADLANLYRSCDALAHPYRGEGFGLPIAEAMATAKPTIVTNYGACLDFCDDSTSYLIPSTLQSADLEGFSPSPVGFWLAQPNKEALSQALLSAIKNPEIGQAMGERARQKIQSNFTWDKAAQLVLDRLNFFSNKIKNR